MKMQENDDSQFLPFQLIVDKEVKESKLPQCHIPHSAQETSEKT